MFFKPLEEFNIVFASLIFGNLSLYQNVDSKTIARTFSQILVSFFSMAFCQHQAQSMSKAWQ